MVTEKELIRKAIEAMEYAYTPYSDFQRTGRFIRAVILKMLLILLLSVQREQRFLRQSVRENGIFRQSAL